MNNTLELSLLTVMPNGIAIVQDNAVAQCKSYRQAVRLAWSLRANKGLTKALLAYELGCYASHVSDYFHKDDKPTRRDLKPEHISKFSKIVGNYCVQQWLNKQSELTILEEIQASRRA